MSLDARKFENLGVNVNQLPWLQKDFEEYRQSDTESLAGGADGNDAAKRSPLLFVVISLYVAWIVYFMATVSGFETDRIVTFSVLVMVLYFINLLCFQRHWAAQALGVILSLPGVIFATRGVVTLSDDGYMFFPFVVLSLLVAYLTTKRSGGDAHGDHVREEQRVFGSPGGIGDAPSPFSQDAVNAGVAGEYSTAALLDLLLHIPGTTVFHGLKFPNSTRADVDHAVVHGSTVFLIDSKMYRNGTYEWRVNEDGDDVIVQTKGHGYPKKNHMDYAAAEYQKMLGAGAVVIPLILIHGKYISIGEKKWSTSGVRLYTAQEALEFIGGTIDSSMRSWKDNKSVRSIMLKNLKHTQQSHLVGDH